MYRRLQRPRRIGRLMPAVQRLIKVGHPASEDKRDDGEG